MNKLTNDIEKLEKQIENLKKREDACDSKRFIYIDCLVDDHIQKNKEHDTKKIASINEIKESMDATQETTKKIKKIDEIQDEKDNIVELEMKRVSKNEETKLKEQEDKSNNIIYYLIMLGIIIFIIIFFIFLTI